MKTIFQEMIDELAGHVRIDRKLVATSRQEDNPGSNLRHLIGNRLVPLNSYVNLWLQGESENEVLNPRQAVWLRKLYTANIGFGTGLRFPFEVDPDTYIGSQKQYVTDQQPLSPQRSRDLVTLFS